MLLFDPVLFPNTLAVKNANVFIPLEITPAVARDGTFIFDIEKP